MDFVSEEIRRYCEAYTGPHLNFFDEVERETWEKTSFPRMLTGRVVGKFLSLISFLLKPRLALDIGTFTGFSAFSIAYGIHLAGLNGKVITFERDKRHIQIFSLLRERCPFTCDIEIVEGDALYNLRKFPNSSCDLIFVDADKENYPNYFDEASRLLRKGGVLIFDNSLWGGRVIEAGDRESRAIAETNSKVLEDRRFEKVLLTVRDGLYFCVKVSD